MHTIETREKEYKGFTIKINIHRDEFSGEPWREHDGHGNVSDHYRSKESKKPGERPIMEHARSTDCRFYDWQGAIVKAKAGGWGLNDEGKNALASKLKKPAEALTRGEIINEAVRLDFEHLRGWLNDEWQWVGYTAEIWQDGEKVQDADASCWGFESTDMDYVYESAFGEAKCEVDTLAGERAELEQFAFELA